MTKSSVLWLRVFCLLALSYSCFTLCPPSEYLAPKCHCINTHFGGSLICENIFNPTELFDPVEATIGSQMFGMTIMNSTLRFIPHDLFERSDFEKIQFVDTELMSFSDGELAFQGLEDHLTEIRARFTSYASQWDFRQLRKLRKITLIDIHHITLDAIPNDLPEFPNLVSFGLSHAKLHYLGDNAFAKCPKLTILGLNDNHLSKLKRSMLPNPALHLDHLDLQKNQLNVLPGDFFTAMPSLQSLYLNGNKFSTLDELIFSNILRSIHTLKMGGNPIHCDCRIMWIVRSKKPMWFEAKCTKPDNLNGVPLKQLSPLRIRC